MHLCGGGKAQFIETNEVQKKKEGDSVMQFKAGRESFFFTVVSSLGSRSWLKTNAAGDLFSVAKEKKTARKKDNVSLSRCHIWVATDPCYSRTSNVIFPFFPG